MKELMKRIGFTEEESAFFLNLEASLTKTQKDRLAYLRERYLNPGMDEKFAGGEWAANNKIGELLTYLAEGMDVSPYSLHMLFLLECGLALPDLYKNAGYDPELAYDLLCDLHYKLVECRKYCGVFGTTVWSWFHNHYLLKRFALGRFQYDLSEWWRDEPYIFGDYQIKKGDKVVWFHIPSSGPMPRKLRMDSYRRIWEFMKPADGIQPIACGSWLLYAGNRHVFPEGSNLMDFMDDFDLIESYENREVFPDAWRVFYKDFTGDTSVLPRDTTLRRNYIKWLDAGNKVGGGTGVILFDGEKIINNKRDS